MVWKWTKQRELAAQLVVEDKLSDVKIADEVGISKSTLELWKLNSQFSQRVEDLVGAARRSLEKYAIADRSKRVARLEKRWAKLDTVVNSRAAGFKTEAARRSGEPIGIEVDDEGGEHLIGRLGDLPKEALTGLLVRTFKHGAGGIFEEYELDTGLLSSEMALARQAAIEAGQWQERVDVTSDGERIEQLSTEEVADKLVGIFERARAKRDSLGDRGSLAVSDGSGTGVGDGSDVGATAP